MKKKLRSITIRKVPLFLAIVCAVTILLSTFFPLQLVEVNPWEAEEVGFTIGNGDEIYTIVIGSPVSATDTADYTCDGSADNTEFQNALNALPATGGQILVLGGTYDWTDSTTVTRAIDNVSIIGIGAAVTIGCDDATAVFTAGGDNWLFSNFKTDAGGIATGSTTGWMKLNVWEDTDYYCLVTDEIDIQDHSSLHGVSGTDTIFPADPGADRYLMWDDDPGSLVWSAVGGGDVSGPGSSTDNAVVRFDGGTGKLIQDYTSNAPTISDTGDINIDGDLDVDNIVVSGTVDGIDVSAHNTATTGVHGITGTILGSEDIGSSLQAWDNDLDDLSVLTPTDSYLIVGDGADWITETGATLRTSIGVYSTSEVDSAIDTDIATHVAAADPHTGYLLESLADAKGDILVATEDDTWSKLAVGTNDYVLTADSGEASGLKWAAIGGGTVDTSGTPEALDFARFTDADTIEGLNYSETRTALGLVIGTNVQAWDADLDAIAALTDTDSCFIVGTGAGWTTESGATARTSLGVYSTTEVDNLLASYITKALFDADTFLYASTDDTPVATSPANVLAALSTHAGATFDWGGQDLNSLGVMFMIGQASAEADISNSGQLWTKSTTNTTLYFTDDAGIDYRLGAPFTITFVIDGGGTTINTGDWGYLEVPFDCTLTNWTLLLDQSATVQLDIWESTYADFPADNGDAMPGAGNEPDTTTAAKNTGACSGWDDYTIAAGNCLVFNLDSNDAAEKLTISLSGYKT